MEIRHLRYFLAVAERGSIAQAARHLNIVQPALSRQIQDLETELGARLFERSVKGTELTAAGKQFMRDASKILVDLESARERALRAAAGYIGSLRVGISPNHTWHPIFLRRLRYFRDAYPNVALLLEPSLASRQIADIKEGRMDGGFFGLRDLDDQELAGVTVLSSGLLLAFPIDSQYAKAPPLQLGELNNEPCVWFSRTTSPVYYDYLIHQCHAAGLSPHIVLICADVATTLGMVAAGMGYSIVSESSRYNCPGEIVLHAHPDLAQVHDVEFIHLASNDSPIVKLFSDVMCSSV